MFRFAQHDNGIFEMSSDANAQTGGLRSETPKKLRRDFSPGRSLLRTIRLNQALFFEAPIFLHCALSCVNCSAERIPLAWVRNDSGFALCSLPSCIRLARSRSCLLIGCEIQRGQLMHSVECALAAPFAQHACLLQTRWMRQASQRQRTR